MKITDIKHYTDEGRLLIAAVAKISTETDKTPDEIMAQLDALAKKMEPDYEPFNEMLRKAGKRSDPCVCKGTGYWTDENGKKWICNRH